MTDQIPTPVAGSRREHDSLGDADVPTDAYWGVSTLRAVDNFPVSGRTIGTLRSLIWGLGAVKYAAARANESLGLLDPEKSAIGISSMAVMPSFASRSSLRCTPAKSPLSLKAPV